MLKFYMAYNDEMDTNASMHFVLAMDYVKKISEGRE